MGSVRVRVGPPRRAAAGPRRRLGHGLGARLPADARDPVAVGRVIPTFARRARSARRPRRRGGLRAPLDDRVGAGELGFVRRRTERPRVALAGSLLDADHFSRGRSDSLDWRGNRRSRSRDKLLPRPSRSSRPRRKAKLEGRRRSRQSPWTCGAAMSMGPPWREFAVKRRGNVTVGHASVIGRAGVQYKREGTK